MAKIAEHSHDFLLTAGESNAEGLMSMRLLGEKIIEVASEHANQLGIGYNELLEHGIGWVLSRVSVEMQRMPRTNDVYRLTTWIESYNRRFSNRNMVITDVATGQVLGYVRTQWMVLEFGTRTGGDIAAFDSECFPILERECPIERPRRIASPGEGCDSRSYTFCYTDIDFNRHVDTVRYIDLIMDCHTLDWHDSHLLHRFDLAFHHECLYGQTAEIRYTPGDALHTDYEILVGGQRAVSAAIDWKPLV